MGNIEDLKTHSVETVAQVNTKWQPLVYVSSSSNGSILISSSLSVYYFVCFAPFAEEGGGQAADSHDRWLCASPCVCLFSASFIPQRNLSQARSIQSHCLTTTFITTGPTRLGSEDKVSFARIWHTVSMKYVENASAYIIRIMCAVHVSMGGLKQHNSNALSTSVWRQHSSEIADGLLHYLQPLHLMEKREVSSWMCVSAGLYSLRVYILNVMIVSEYAWQFCSWQKPDLTILISYLDKKWQ